MKYIIALVAIFVVSFILTVICLNIIEDFNPNKPGPVHTGTSED